MNQLNKLVAVMAKAQLISIPRCYLNGVQGEIVASVDTAISHYLPMQQLFTCGLKLKMVSTGSS